MTSSARNARTAGSARVDRPGPATAPVPGRGPLPDADAVTRQDALLPGLDDEPDVADTPAGPVPRRTLLRMLVATAVVAAAALVAVLVTWEPEPTAPARDLTRAEADRFAALRVTNHRDVRSGLRITVGSGAGRLDLVGWVDWALPLVYLDVGGPGAGADRGLVQATPTHLLTRPDPTAVPTPAPPPLLPPTDRWRFQERPLGLGPLLDLLFGLAADNPDLGAGHGVRWLGTATAGNAAVDLVQGALPGSGRTAAVPSFGPATPLPDTGQAGRQGAGTTGPPSGTPRSGAPARADDRPTGRVVEGHPRYWLDRDARLRRLEARLPGDVPVAVELNRTDRPVLRPVAALGGRPGLPRQLTVAEQRRLAKVPAALRARGAGPVTVTAPVTTSRNLRAAGWLSWTGAVAYLSVADLNAPERRTLVRHGAAGTLRTQRPTTPADGTAEAPARPPVAAPTTGWQRGRADDLDRLVGMALHPDRIDLAAPALRLREERLAGRTVDVIEVRTAPAPSRLWIDRAGRPHRLELRGSAGTWLQLDVHTGPVPRLPSPPPR
ncbi:hypothetical protein ABT336_15010 [Micromonospora sp. NPDC000207]|uniref:hypothetical protein n=1 Tax=Micromonospora sp. NPDC000207 TaxID=3154246 RepID=UPI00331F190B